MTFYRAGSRQSSDDPLLFLKHIILIISRYKVSVRDWRAAFSRPTCVASAQELRPPRLGVILQGGPWYAVLDGLRQGLKQLGLIEESTLFWTFATLKEI